ncbi:MAG: p-aminobenzoyl-glutamate hydrolase subunit B [Firmicutes bacterium]|nr:p-aminobenzoyl-glutamate hydrolase subunit B [candidate division NPL-UPA2 bacterium]MBT9153716.1 p-aminobenzoyl-glutamate hydrolase subunit B [candidate division NPL-UPA2 bacterium]
MTKQAIYAAIDAKLSHFTAISDWMYHHPEIGHKEHQAASMLAGELSAHGFAVEMPYAGLATAFKAVYRAGDGPTIALLAEYDALPGIGHGCGHNIIGCAAVLAAIGLKEGLGEGCGTVIVFGAPAEEGAVDNAGGKVFLIEHGAFVGVDAALMVHPATRNVIGGSSNAREALEIVFKGKPAHAAGAPHEGINALDAAIQTFNGFNALRQHVQSDVRIHGIISEGGVAPNIVPERAVIRLYVRASAADYLETVVEKVKNCARAGALATGAEVQFRQTAKRYKNMLNNSVLSAVFKANMEALGEEIEETQVAGAGSTDMANVSHVVPAIHPYIRISDSKLVGHSREFADATLTPAAHAGLAIGAKAMAGTVVDIFGRQDLQRALSR